MAGLKQLIVVAGAFRQRDQLARPVARLRGLAAEIGIEPQAPFGLIHGLAVVELFTEFGGATIGLPHLGALHAAHRGLRGTNLQQEINLAAHPFGGHRQTLRRLDPRAEIRDRLGIGRGPQRAIAGAHAVLAGLGGDTGFAEVMSEQFRLVCRDLGEFFLERAGDTLVQLAPPRQQQAFIGGVPHQRVLEVEAALDAAPFGENDTGCHQVRQSRIKLGFLGRDRVE
jgi:hypothetical protein